MNLENVLSRRHIKMAFMSKEISANMDLAQSTLYTRLRNNLSQPKKEFQNYLSNIWLPSMFMVKGHILASGCPTRVQVESGLVLIFSALAVYAVCSDDLLNTKCPQTRYKRL